MSVRPNSFFLSARLMRVLLLTLIFLSACQAVTPAVGPTETVPLEETAAVQPSATISRPTPTKASKRPSAAPTEPVPTEIPPTETAEFLPSVAIQVAAQVGGEVTDIEINGDYAYLAVGPRLVVLDLSNPETLQIAAMSDLLPGLGKAVAIEGERLYWVSDNGVLLAFALDDPLKPALLGQHEIPLRADEIVLKDGIAWVGFLYAESDALRAYDLRAIEEGRVEEIASLDAPGGLVASDDYFFLYRGQIVIDVRNPHQPVVIPLKEYLNTDVEIEFLAFIEPYAFFYYWEPLDVNSTKWQAHLQAWDMRAPDAPTQLSDVPVNWGENPWFGLGPGTIFGNRMYTFISDGLQGDIVESCPFRLQVMDLSDLTNPRIVAKTDQPLLHCVRDVKAVGNKLYVVDWHGLALLDVSNPTAPRLLDRLGSPPQIEGMARKGDFLLAASNFLENSLNVFNVETTFPPDFAGASPLGSAPYLPIYEAFPPGTASGLAVSGDSLFVPRRNEGLSVVDIRQSRTPKEIVHDPNIGNLSGQPQSAAVLGKTLFFTINRDAVSLVDIRDPTNPRDLGTLPELSLVFDVAAGSGLLYVIAGDPATLIVLNVDDPTAPKETARLPITLGQNGAAISITGDRAYVTGVGIGTESDLAIFDLSDPARPEQLGTLAGIKNVWDIAGQGEWVMVACATYIDSDIWVVDAENPAQPKRVGHIKTPGMSTRVIADDSFFYLSANQGGLWKLKVVDLE